MKNTEIDAANPDIPSNSCNSARNEEIGIAINSNCKTKLILADIDAPVYTVLSRNNMGDDMEIKEVDSSNGESALGVNTWLFIRGSDSEN